MKKMYKKLIFSLLALFAMNEMISQTIVTIPTGNTVTTVTNTTVHRKPLGSLRSCERSAMKYTNSEIGIMGTITAVGFYCDTINNPGKTAIKIYLKEIPDSTFAAASTVATEEAGATLVYSDTIYPASFIKGTWVTVTLTTPFLHASTNNIEVVVETNNGVATSGSDNPTALAKGFRASGVPASRMQYWQSPNGSSTPPAGNGTLVAATRSNIQLTITPLAACTAPPTPGTTMGPASVCSGSTATLTLNGNSIGTGQTYQWMSSPNAITWSAIPGATNAAYTATVSAVTYYHCVLTCSGQKDSSTNLQININPFYNCYCTTGIGGGCTAPSAIDSVTIAGTTLNNGPLTCPTNNYIAYPASGNTTASLTQGQSYALVTKYGGAVIASVWIDYNHDGVFSTGAEWKQICLTTSGGTTFTTNIVIPFSSTPGLTGMRIRTRTGSTNDSTSACTAFGSGETQDYVINIIAASPCTSPPTPGITVATPTTVCAGGTTNLSLNGNSTGSGQTYQWMSSPNGTTWSAIAGATLPVYTATVNAVTHYHCVLKCSGQKDSSVDVIVNINPFYNCYCTNGIGGGCVAASAIDSVTIAGTTLNNGPLTCPTNNYIAYPASGNTTATLTQGLSYPLVTKFGGAVIASVWIDYNHDGIFTGTNEWQQICLTTSGGTTFTTNIVIPFTSQLGLTGMRIRTRTGSTNDSTSACTAFGSGETQDYVINIIAGSPCISPPTPGVTVATPTTVCAGGTINLSLNGNSTGIGQTYQWMTSANGTIWSAIAGATSSVHSTTVNAVTYFHCVLKCSGQADTSTDVMININPFYNCYCTGGIGGGCTTTAIDSVNIATTTLDNGPTGCSTNNYTVYPASGNTTATLLLGMTYTLNTTFTGTVNCSMWIDYNHSGTFDTSEWTQVCTTSTAMTNVAAMFTVPSGAMTGITGMRLRSRSTAGLNDSTSACTAFGSGETEDYILTLSNGSTNVKQNSAAQLYIFPNPSNGVVNIGLNLAKTSKVNYQIVNVAGETVYSEQSGSVSGTVTKSLNLSGLTKGIYFVRVITDKEILMKKVILQ